MTPSGKVHPLMAAIAGGDTRAFAELYRLSSPKLYGLVLRVLRQQELAGSAMRRAFARIGAEAGRLGPREDGVAFLVVRARAATFDVARAHPGLDAWEPFEVAEPAADPLALAARSPALTRLLGCLGTLTEERRRMLLLAYYDGWSIDAISVVFDAPSAVVRAMIARSTAQIAECLAARKAPPRPAGKSDPGKSDPGKSDPGKSGPGDADQALAAEYALGTLGGAERALLAARLESEPDLAALVRRWERRLAPLHELAAPVAPPPELGQLIAADFAADFKARQRKSRRGAVSTSVSPRRGPKPETTKNAGNASPEAAGLLARMFGRSGNRTAPPADRRRRPSWGAATAGSGATTPSVAAIMPASLLPVPGPPAPPLPMTFAAGAAVAKAPLAAEAKGADPGATAKPLPRLPAAAGNRGPEAAASGARTQAAPVPRGPRRPAASPPLTPEARLAAFRTLSEAIDLRIGNLPLLAPDAEPPPAPALAGIVADHEASEPVVSAGFSPPPAVSPAEPAHSSIGDLPGAGAAVADSASRSGEVVAPCAVEERTGDPSPDAPTAGVAITSPAREVEGEGATDLLVTAPTSVFDPSAMTSPIVGASGEAYHRASEPLAPDATAAPDAGLPAGAPPVPSSPDEAALTPRSAFPDAPGEVGSSAAPLADVPGISAREVGSTAPAPLSAVLSPASPDPLGEAGLVIVPPSDGSESGAPAPGEAASAVLFAVLPPVRSSSDPPSETGPSIASPADASDSSVQAAGPAASGMPSVAVPSSPDAPPGDVLEPSPEGMPESKLASSGLVGVPSTVAVVPAQAPEDARSGVEACPPFTLPAAGTPPPEPVVDGAESALSEASAAAEIATPVVPAAHPAPAPVAPPMPVMPVADAAPLPVAATPPVSAMDIAAPTPSSSPEAAEAASALAPADDPLAPVGPARPVALPPPVFRSAAGAEPHGRPSARHPVAGIGRRAPLAGGLRQAMASPALVAGLGVALVGLAGTFAWREWTHARGAPVLSVLQSVPAPTVMVRIDPPTGGIKVHILEAEPPAGGRYALWLVTPNGGTHLLARFSSGVEMVAPVLRRLDRATLAASSLNVTLEPSEAATGGGAAVPDVVYRGRLLTD